MTIEAELISVNSEGAICWLDIADGLRIKANIPEHALLGLNLLHGREFLWDVNSRRALEKSEPKETAERRELRKQLNALREEFHNGSHTQTV